MAGDRRMKRNHYSISCYRTTGGLRRYTSREVGSANRSAYSRGLNWSSKCSRSNGSYWLTTSRQTGSPGLLKCNLSVNQYKTSSLTSRTHNGNACRRTFYATQTPRLVHLSSRTEYDGGPRPAPGPAPSRARRRRRARGPTEPRAEPRTSRAAGARGVRRRPARPASPGPQRRRPWGGVGRRGPTRCPRARAERPRPGPAPAAAARQGQG